MTTLASVLSSVPPHLIIRASVDDGEPFTLGCHQECARCEVERVLKAVIVQLRQHPEAEGCGQSCAPSEAMDIEYRARDAGLDVGEK